MLQKFLEPVELIALNFHNDDMHKKFLEPVELIGLNFHYDDMHKKFLEPVELIALNFFQQVPRTFYAYHHREN
jgi:hypothetical protein